MTSATNELCRLLDERGVKYEVTFFETFTDTEWRVNDASCTYTELQDTDSAYLTIQDITPDRVIAATLGPEREKELEELVRDLFQLRCRQSCVDCEHEDDEGCDFMTRALELEIEVYR